ncbi:hypothetical protein ACQJBY_062429 [Aegilops geniculata]
MASHAMDSSADDLFYRALQSLEARDFVLEGQAEDIAQEYADALFRDLTGVDYNSDLVMADTDDPDAPDDPALGEAVAEALKTVEAPSDGQGCPICMEDDGDDDAATTYAGAWKETPCGHRFHGQCVERWLQAKGSCPMCRHQVVTMPAAAASSTSSAVFAGLELAEFEDVFREFMRQGASYFTQL